MRRSDNREPSTVRLVIRALIKMSLFPFVFFLPAGTFFWPEAWVLIVIAWGGAGCNLIWLMKNNPDLMRERLKRPFRKDQKNWDKIITSSLFGISLIWIPLPGFDVVRFGWSKLPFIFEILGFLGVVVAFVIIGLAMRENAFLSTVVRIQKDRDHQVIQTGPYRLVRHPMYCAMILLYPSWTLALGSYYATLLSSLLIVIILIRTYLEDKTLQEELDGYNEYTKKVRYRILPFIW